MSWLKRFFNFQQTQIPGGAQVLSSSELLVGGNRANVLVNPETSMKVSAFFSCVRNISEDVAKLPFQVFREDSRGNKTLMPNHPAALLLNKKPNKYNTPLDFKQIIIERALRRGNGYAFIERNDDAVPVALHFLDNNCVVPMIGDRELFYQVNEPRLKIDGIFTSSDIFHLRGLGDGFLGKSVINYAQESIAVAIATQEYSSKFYGGGANMTGIVKFTGITDETKLKAAKDGFKRSYAEDGLAATTGSAEFTKLSFSADEAQMLGAKEFNVKDVARWFRMPLSKLQTSDAIANIEALAIEYVNDCLEPWITRFEQEANDKLLSESEKLLSHTHVDTFPLLKGDTAAMERRLKTLFFIGGYSANDALRSLGMNTIGANGDVRYVPVNVIPDSQVKQFWESKTPDNIPTGSPDATGSGANNANINQQ